MKRKKKKYNFDECYIDETYNEYVMTPKFTERDLTKLMSNYITKEIDREIVEMLKNVIVKK